MKKKLKLLPSEAIDLLSIEAKDVLLKRLVEEHPHQEVLVKMLNELLKEYKSINVI